MTSEDDSLTFPDEPRAELDRALSELVDRAQEVLTTQGRLRALLRANQAVVAQLELPVVLRRIVESAVGLVGAQYGALGVIAPQGGLEQFINVGMPPEQAKSIGHLPEGHGLLGALIDDPRPIRLRHLSEDSRSAGFPASHPSMDSFLGVPVRVRDEVYGNLYLTNQASGKFSKEDEELVTALAATAGFAIDNARLFAETRRRQAWAAASAEVTSALLSSERSDSISILVGRVLLLSEADLVCVVLPTDDPAKLAVGTARGVDEESLEGTLVDAEGSIAGSVLEGLHPRLVNDGDRDEISLPSGARLGPVMALPLMVGSQAEGALIVARLHDSMSFSPADLEMAADFAGQASVAMELAKARATRQRMLLLEDRGRIARDLHDHVIQQLFATGLELQSLAGAIAPSPEADRVIQSVSSLDAAIAQIRTVIFALSSQSADRRDTVRHWIIDLANELAPGLARTPAVQFSGPVDLVVTDGLADDVIAVTREALTNSAKYAEAENTTVSLAATDGWVVLEIADDGVGGVSASPRRSGLANLEERALRRRGTFSLESDDTGTRVRWSVPFDLAD
ncbi:GAF domain-containing protein [Lacisediminihabitans sp.]|uniref:sensor histidine kinase n=1 Tax=Lacisediminihabitans sp. TaxID=2787631 RepID=UPI00374CB14E